MPPAIFLKILAQLAPPFVRKVPGHLQLRETPMLAKETEFDYQSAFARNLGLVNEDEQAKLRAARVALPGLGGVGGAHLQGLARMGIGAFHLADPDIFETVNFNRQLGATMTTIGCRKVHVMAQLAASINPSADVKAFSDGLTPENVDAFLQDVDVVVDGLEFFAMSVRRLLYRECRVRGIPVVNAGPIGYGAALLVFTADGISFDEFFGIDDSMTRAEQLLAMGLALGPGLAGDLDPKRVDFENEKGPALASACLLCAALASTEVLKLVTGRGTVTVAPAGKYFDPFRGQILPLKIQPNFQSAEGRTRRDRCFERFPALKAMHVRESLARKRVANTFSEATR
jgi:molybdopterin/thiamine biosynthesis adenylyltransferase